MFASLRGRLAAAMIVVLLLGGGGMAALLSARSQSADELLEETSLGSQANDTLAGLRPARAGGSVIFALSSGWSEAYRTSDGAFFTLYDARARALARSPNLMAPLPFVPFPAHEPQSPLQLEGPQQRLTLAVRTPGGGELVVARDNPGMRGDGGDDRLALLAPAAIFALAMTVAGLLVLLVSGWSLRPLNRAARDAARIGPDEPSARLALEGLPSEVRPLAEAMNHALDRVARAYTAERRFTADAAHALRTPLTVLDLRLQKLETGDPADLALLRADVDELSRIVGDLLRLSRGERGLEAASAFGAVNFSRVVREAAAAVAPLLEAQGRAIEVELPGEAPVRGDAGTLRDAVSALLDNARVHGEGIVRARLVRDADAAVLDICDEGAGVAPGAGEAVFERFYKVRGDAAGAGLGLAIARQVMVNHGGDVRFVAPAEVRLRVPLAKPLAPVR